jgi:hypothetical protein
MKSFIVLSTLLISLSVQASDAPTACTKTLVESEGYTDCVFAGDTIKLLEILAESNVAEAYGRLQADGLTPNTVTAEVKDDANNDFGNTQKIDFIFGKCHGPFGPRTTDGASFKVSRRLDKRIMDAAIYRTEVSRIRRFTIRCR